MLHLGIDLLFLVPGAGGGRETYARELLRALRRARPDMDVTAFTNPLTGAWSDADRTVTIAAATPRSRMRWAGAEILALPRAASRAGIDLLHSPANVAPLHGPFARVLTLHDLLFTQRATLALVRAGARRADRVITGSEWARGELVRRLGLKDRDIDVIAHGVTAAPPATPETPPIALVVAADLPHKNLDGALRGLAALPVAERPRLVMAGRGTNGWRVRAIADELGVQDAVELLGGVSAEELEHLYGRASVLLSPSRAEGFGLTVLEAMARDVPVVCSDIPASREVAGDAAVWFAPDDPPALAEAIRRALAHGDELRERGRGRAARFTWDRTAEQTLAAYERVLAARRYGGRR